jgi:DNA-binding XRE family transcriptional regulator
MVAQREPYEFPAIRAFAAELAAWRGTMSKVELAETLGYTPQLISQLEAEKNIPSRKFAEDTDTLFKTNGLFVRLWKLITDTRHLSVLPPGFPRFVELEAQATTVRSFQHLLVTGLLQTEAYARTLILCLHQPDAAEEFLATRMDRQKILDRENPPRLWFTIDERGLRWMIGGRDVMRAQLQHLLKMSERPNIMIEVIPQETTGHAGLGNGFTLLSFVDGPDVGYTEAVGRGHLVQDPADVHELQIKYDLLRGHALPVGESRKLIESIMESL